MNADHEYPSSVKSLWEPEISNSWVQTEEFLSALPFSYLFFLLLAIPPAYQPQHLGVLKHHLELCDLTQGLFQLAQRLEIQGSL